MSDLIRLLGERGVAFTVDSYHLLADWESREGNGTPSDEFWKCEVPFIPAHVHVSNLQRKWYLAKDDGMKGFARQLHELGYDGRVSLECSWGDISSEQIIALEEARSLFSA
jgi:sugar phosphate isomerase/epimerase